MSEANEISVKLFNLRPKVTEEETAEANANLSKPSRSLLSGRSGRMQLCQRRGQRLGARRDYGIWYEEEGMAAPAPVSGVLLDNGRYIFAPLDNDDCVRKLSTPKSAITSLPTLPKKRFRIPSTRTGMKLLGRESV